MNYLTNYYKNLSEQLQQRLNQLQVALNESRMASIPPKDPMPYSEREGLDTEDTETDDDIIAMRQRAADQGGIPQDMVREPIRRTKQLPDGTLIYSESLPKPVQRPNIDGGPIPYPKPSPKPTTPPPPPEDHSADSRENNRGKAPMAPYPKPVQRPDVGVSPNRPKPLIRLDNLGLPFPKLKPKPSPEEIERERLDKWWQEFKEREEERKRELAKTPEEREEDRKRELGYSREERKEQRRREEERKRKKRQQERDNKIGHPRKDIDPYIPEPYT